jgi:hypothetical protein
LFATACLALANCQGVAANKADDAGTEAASVPTEQELTRAWEMYEADIIAAQTRKDERWLKQLESKRAALVADIAKLPGLVRVANVFWVDGRALEPGERLEYRSGDAGEWQPCTVGRYANKLVLDDASSERLLDVDAGSVRRR